MGSVGKCLNRTDIDMNNVNIGSRLRGHHAEHSLVSQCLLNMDATEAAANHTSMI